MNTIGSLQGDVQAVENTINSGNVNSANYAKALTFTSIPKNANLNNYNTAGLYFNASTAETKTISNVPIGEAFLCLCLQRVIRMVDRHKYGLIITAVVYIYDITKIGLRKVGNLGKLYFQNS